MYYGVELGMYVNMLAEDLTVPLNQRAKDHKVTIVHHIVTLGLLLASAYFRAFSIGCLILFIHDLADPFLEVSRLNYKKSHNQCLEIKAAQFSNDFRCRRLFTGTRKMTLLPRR